MKFIAIFALTVWFFSLSYGQSATELYNSKDFQGLIQLEKKSDKLTADELYMVGFAFFQLANDEKAIKFYDKAIAKGLNNSTVHFYKGLSLRFLKKYDDALREIEIAIEMDPLDQEYMNEKGVIYFDQKEYDKALEVFEKAKLLPTTFPEPFYWIARIHDERGDFDKALKGYYEATAQLPKESSWYVTTWVSIGQIEYQQTKDYQKSIKAFTTAIQLDKENYDLYYRLMVSYNAAKEYTKADSLFGIVKAAFDKGKLSKEDMEIGTVMFAQFEWNGQRAAVRRSLVEPKEVLDISYKVFLIDKAGDKVERRFLVEKSLQIGKNGAKHLLCEQDKESGSHITYPYGWSTDTIPVEDLQKAVEAVLDGKMKPGASSNFGGK